MKLKDKLPDAECLSGNWNGNSHQFGPVIRMLPLSNIVNISVGTAIVIRSFFFGV